MDSHEHGSDGTHFPFLLFIGTRTRTGRQKAFFAKVCVFTGSLFSLTAYSIAFAQTISLRADASSNPIVNPLETSASGGRFLLMIGLSLLFIAAHAFVVTAEISMITLRKPRLRQLVEEGNPSALRVEALLQDPARLIATTQTSSILFAAFAAGIAAFSIAPPVAEWLQLFFGWPLRYATPVGLIGVLLPVALLTLILGGIAPRSLALNHAERLAMLSVRQVSFLQLLLSPVVIVVRGLANLLLKPFGGTASFLSPAANEEELKMMVEASEEQGVLEENEREMITAALNFADTIVRRIMTPRIDLTGIEIEAGVPVLIQTITESGHSRIPIYEGDWDNVVGVVHAKDLLVISHDRPVDERAIREFMSVPYFIPETKKIADLLADFRRDRQQIAFVRDEYGTLAGLVTMEDIVEEIVGDIQDEYDDEKAQITVIDATNTLFDGMTALEDVSDRMGIELPEEDADTIGGFVFALLGRQAEQGDSVQWEDTTFVVENTDGKRVTQVRIVHDAPLVRTEAA